MTAKAMDDAASAPEASTPGVTLRVWTHMAGPSHALILREWPKPTQLLELIHVTAVAFRPIAARADSPPPDAL